MTGDEPVPDAWRPFAAASPAVLYAASECDVPAPDDGWLLTAAGRACEWFSKLSFSTPPWRISTSKLSGAWPVLPLNVAFRSVAERSVVRRTRGGPGHGS